MQLLHLDELSVSYLPMPSSTSPRQKYIAKRKSSSPSSAFTGDEPDAGRMSCEQKMTKTFQWGWICEPKISGDDFTDAQTQSAYETCHL
jgi:hypothetical protein